MNNWTGVKFAAVRLSVQHEGEAQRRTAIMTDLGVAGFTVRDAVAMGLDVMVERGYVLDGKFHNDDSKLVEREMAKGVR